MQHKGQRLIGELKYHVLETMTGMPECQTNGQGIGSSSVQDLAGLNLGLSAQDGWLTWSILSSLADDGKVEAIRRKRRLYWKLV